MARRPALQLGGKGGEGTGRCGSLDVGEGGAEVPWGRLYRLARGGKAASQRPWPSMAAALIELRGEGLRRGGNGRLMRGKGGGELHSTWLRGFEGGGAEDPVGNGRWP
jgi:hypothetical protein